jgi:outer membrane protein assembly factor BamB
MPGSHQQLLRRFVTRLAPPLAAVAFSLAAAPGIAAWPEFRGPSGQGIAGDAAVALHWSESENIAWKTALPGRGWSTPVINGGLLWMTAAADNGRSLQVLAVDPKNGELKLNVEVFQIENPPPVHEKNSYASPTPILEGDRVYVHFGTLGSAALNTKGEILWKNQELRFEHAHGPGGSAAATKDLLIVSCDGTDRQFVAALEKSTGRVRWRTSRKDAAMAFSTPLRIEAGGVEQIVSPGANRAVSYEASTGRELWSIRYEGFSNVPRPVFAHGLVYVMSGFYNPVVYAVKPDGRGDVTRTHVAWQYGRGVPLTPSPIVVGGEFYMVSDRGIATCLDAKTGELLWQQRVGGEHSASPIHAAGRIYFLSESGEATVIEPGRVFKELAKNPIDGRTLASLAVDGSTIYLRSATHLYRIDESKAK